MTTLSEVTIFAKEIYEKKELLDKFKAELEEESKKLEAMKAKFLVMLDEAGLEKLAVPDCGTFYKTKRTSVKVNDKPSFFEYLKEKGIFEDMVSVNYQTLNSYYKQELETAIEGGNVDFSIPGVGEPTVFITLGIRKG